MNILFLLHTSKISGANKSLGLALSVMNVKNIFRSIYYISLDNQAETKFFQNYKRLDFNFDKKNHYGLKQRFYKKFFGKPFSSPYQDSIASFESLGLTVLWANTIVTLFFAIDIKKKFPELKLILHIHEMEIIIKQICADISIYDSFIDTYIVVSEYSYQFLISLGIPSVKIRLIHECSELQVYNKNHLPENSDFFKVVMVGDAHWRKGDDLFIQVANKVLKKTDSIQFYWIGNVDSIKKTIIENELKKLNISSSVHFIAEQLDCSDLIQQMDLFLLTSREDPFPLVAIEAGMAGLPIICFKDTTGIEFHVQKSCGVAVDYLDIELMAVNVLNYFENRNNLKTQKEFIKSYYSRFSPNLIAEQLLKIFE